MVAPAIVAAGISAGASLLGGLFGGKSEKQENTVDYVKMVKWAEKAGFNPLTALRAGGAAGFTTTTSHPALSAWSGVGNAISQVAAAYDPEGDERAALQDDLMRAQLKNIEAETGQRLRSMEVPSKMGANAVDWAGRPVKSLASQIQGQILPMEKISVTDPFNSGGRYIDRNVGDAQYWGDRYGEPGEWLGGAYVGYKDATHYMKQEKPVGTAVATENKVKSGLYGLANDPVAHMKTFNDWVGNEVNSAIEDPFKALRRADGSIRWF